VFHLWHLERNAREEKLRLKNSLQVSIPQTVELCLLSLLFEETAQKDGFVNNHSR